MSHQYGGLFDSLKKKSFEYIVKNLAKDFAESLLLATFSPPDTQEEEMEVFDHLDEFMLFGETLDGEPVLEFLIDKLRWSREEKEVLREWKEAAFFSVFDVLKIEKDRLCLRDWVSEAEYEVFFSAPDLPPSYQNFQGENFIFVTFVSIHGVWFLSDLPKTVSSNVEEAVFREFVQKQPSENYYRHNPEKLKAAFELQKKFYDCFVSLFGADEIIISGKDLKETRENFFQAWQKQKNFCETEPAGDFEPELLAADDVGVLIDEREGPYYLLNYGKFKKIFSENGELSDGQVELFKDYLLCASVPAFVFRRAKDRYPERFCQVIKKIVPSSEFKGDSIFNFDLLMNHYKPFWRKINLSVHPVNLRFKKYYFQQTGVGRNSPCPCGSGLKFKKCCER